MPEHTDHDHDHDRDHRHDHRNTTDEEAMRDVGTELVPQTTPETTQHHEKPLGAVSDDQAPTGAVSRRRGGLVLAVVIAVVLAIVIYSGIRARSKNERTLTRNTDAVATPIVHVIAPVGMGASAAEVVLPANVAAFVDTPIYARTSGYLRHWYFDIGARVAQGALLAVIESPEIDQQAYQAQADVKTAQANLEIAQTTAARWEKLLQKNAVSRQEADQTRSDLAARQSALAAQQANLSRIQRLQDFERVYAPFAGVVTARNVDTGSLIEAGQNTTQRELFHLASAGKLRVFVPVPEVYQSAVHDGARVEITLDAFPNEKFYGTLARSSRAVDPLSRTLNVEVDVNNTTGRLLPGAYAFVHLNLPPNAQALRIPANTLLFRRQGMQVGVVENGRVMLRSVKIGHDYGAMVEITDGLKATDKIVVDPSDSIENGDPVQVETADAAAKKEAQ